MNAMRATISRKNIELPTSHNRSAAVAAYGANKNLPQSVYFFIFPLKWIFN